MASATKSSKVKVLGLMVLVLSLGCVRRVPVGYPKAAVITERWAYREMTPNQFLVWSLSARDADNAKRWIGCDRMVCMSEAIGDVEVVEVVPETKRK